MLVDLKGGLFTGDLIEIIQFQSGYVHLIYRSASNGIPSRTISEMHRNSLKNEVSTRGERNRASINQRAHRVMRFTDRVLCRSWIVVAR